jgi:hypothetical protein
VFDRRHADHKGDADVPAPLAKTSGVCRRATIGFEVTTKGFVAGVGVMVCGNDALST